MAFMQSAHGGHESQGLAGTGNLTASCLHFGDGCNSFHWMVSFSGAVSATVLLQVELPAWAYPPPPRLPEVQARAAPSSPARPQIPVPGAPDFPANTSRRRSTSRYRAPE